MQSTVQAKRIAVLMGGPGSERDVSLASGRGVANALRSLGADVIEVDAKGPDFTLPPHVDIAFNVIHGTFGEDGQLQRILEERGVAYTGEGILVSELAIDKIATKVRFVDQHVPTPASEILRDGAHPTLPPPIVIKAPREGSSVGVFIVHELAKLAPALEEARALSAELLVEKYIPGREFTVGIVGGEVLPIIEIRAHKDFYNFKNKYPFLDPNATTDTAPGCDHLCPAPLTDDETRLVQETALSAYRALGLQVYCRVDVILSTEGEPFVLEVNTIPGMTPSSLLPEAAAASGLPYPELCARIVDLSLHARR